MNPAAAQPAIETMRIRPATVADVEVVLSLIHELAEYEKLLHEVVATPALVREALFGQKPVAECVLACLGEQPVGFALFFHNYSTFMGRAGLYLEDLFVRPEHRGQGIGEALLRHLARLALERGCSRMEWAVLDWNKRAIEFYERMGAVGIHDWSVFRLTGPALLRLGS
ncbi:MAG TPA: GNAT family N-acetyltransferase [Steroidobacteraceae bacterium]|nr:GNAT family N-acetyltransferase [Steroidobacteraceae bacterium]